MRAVPGSAAHDLDRGRKVGKYEILTRLSMGGMAELFLAFTAGPGGFRKFVAVKQILPDVKRDEQFVRMFLDEARITAAFTHANIAQVFDLGEDAGELYLAMEFISGQNLEQVLKRSTKREKPVPVGFAARVVRDACLGLHYAHAFIDATGKPAPVIHRDVSHKNVMVTYTGDTKMIDFGIAKARGRLNRTQVGIVKGTSGYMSPEQVRGEQLDGRSDLFSAGVMLHEMLCNARLFQGNNDAEMMLKIVEGEIRKPRAVNPEVPQALSDAVMKSLERKRDKRFATGKEMARAIEQGAGEVMFDEDHCAAYMRELFDDKIEATRRLLEQASKEDADGLSGAVAALREEASESKNATPRGREAGGSATPLRGMTPKRPSNVTRAAPPEPDPTPPPRARPSPETKLQPLDVPTGVNRYKSAVGRDYAMYDVAEQETERRPNRPKQPAETQEVATRMRPSQRNRAVADETLPPTNRRKKGGAGKWIALLLFVGAVGGVFGYPTTRAMVMNALAPKLEEAKKSVTSDLQEPPPPPAPKKLTADDVGKSTAVPFSKEAIKVIQQQKEHVDNAPVTVLPENYVDTPVEPTKVPSQAELATRLAAMDKAYPPHSPGQDALDKIKRKLGDNPDDAHRSDATLALDNLEKEIPPPTPIVIPRPGEKARPKQPKEGEAVVLDTHSKKGAASAGIGWLTVYTVPPTEVFEKGTNLGMTPLIKVPLEGGTYKLRVVDPDGQNRLLSAIIKPGEETSLKIKVTDLPLE